MGSVLELSGCELPARTPSSTATVVGGTTPAATIPEAALAIERRGGCLLCINVSAESRACLSAAGTHAVLMEP